MLCRVEAAAEYQSGTRTKRRNQLYKVMIALEIIEANSIADRQTNRQTRTTSERENKTTLATWANS